MTAAATRPAVFLDRDGTVIDELGYLADPDGVKLYPGAGAALRALQHAGFALVIVTNQSGVARGLIQEQDLARVHQRLGELLGAENVVLTDVLHCPHHPTIGPDDYRRRDCECRKPRPGMLLEAARRHSLELARSFLIGDARRDLQAGWAAGLCGTLLVATGKGPQEEARLTAEERRRTLFVANLAEAAELLVRGRQAT